MNRVDIIANAVATFYRKTADPDYAAHVQLPALARFIDNHLRPEVEPMGSIAHTLGRIARCVENIDARQANRDFESGR